MQLVEQHVIKKIDRRYQAIDAAAFKAKNLYNAALYEVRQAFIHQQSYLNYNTIDKLMKRHEAYTALPRKVSQQVLKLLDKNWQAFFATVKAFREHPERFVGHPKLPKYKHKTEGRSVLVYTIQAVSSPGLRGGKIIPSQLGIEVQTRQKDIQQVRIVPKSDHYVVEVVYKQAAEPASVDPSLVAGIDIGIDNLATLTSNKAGFRPMLITGKPLKSVNQWYNKQRADLQGRLPEKRFTSHRLDRVTETRNRQVRHILHTASRRIIDLLVTEGIGTLVIGKNPNWKQECTMGKRTNQNFVQIPHARFIDMVTYKAKLVGISVILTEESYTSKCSFLDSEPMCKQEVYVGKRVKRGLFRSATGKQFNADVNGSLNIIRKVLPDAFGKGIPDVVVHPQRLHVGTR